MPTNKEKYGHDEMTSDELEERIAADMLELSDRLRVQEYTKAIGSLIWVLMGRCREAYRTARLIMEEH